MGTVDLPLRESVPLMLTETDRGLLIRAGGRSTNVLTGDTLTLHVGPFVLDMTVRRAD